MGNRRIRPICELTGPLRAVKGDDELRAIRKAIRLAQRAFSELIAPGARALLGRSERDVAGELDYRMQQLGAAGAAFETIVAAGAGSSNPHYSPSAARIRPGQAVLFDWGALVDGYCSDLTRVVFTGRIPRAFADVYRVVLRAQAAGIAAIRPGVACRSVDAAARKVIEAAGYGRQFLHSFGHGVGREVHEQPVLAQGATGRLRKGMVVTAEPGVYLPGVGGIRIEDDVLVTRDGRRRLSSLPRDPAAMTLR
jgi:Xaa-Pro aminopeptidase